MNGDPMLQLICHLFGDYILQSDWMAKGKRSNWLTASCHAWIYSCCFFPLFIGRPHFFYVWLAIFMPHFIIDRLGLVRYMVWAKNWIAPWHRETITEIVEKAKKENRLSTPCAQPGELEALQVLWKNPRLIPPTPTFSKCSRTGYPPDMPEWMAQWLTIIADNALHVLTNYLALRYL